MKFWTKTLALALVASIGAAAFAQGDGKVIRRIKIRQADPALIMRLLAGDLAATQSEYSTIINVGGANGGFGNSGPGGGNRSGGSFGGPGMGDRRDGSSFSGPGSNGRSGSPGRGDRSGGPGRGG